MAPDVVAEIRRVTRRKFKAEDKIRIVLEGLPGDLGLLAVLAGEYFTGFVLPVGHDDPYYGRRDSMLERRRNLKRETLLRRKGVNGFISRPPEAQTLL